MDSHDKNRLFQKGLEAFNSGHFYEAHEHWEEVWLETLDPEKMFLQGLIQVAAAFHHYSRANRQGTQNLLRAGLTKVERFPQVHGGLALEPLRVAVRRWLAALQDGDDPAKEEIPRIEWLGGGSR
jgi:predicted metal-dependent hydrolase